MKSEGMDAAPQLGTGLIYFNAYEEEWTCVSDNLKKQIGNEDSYLQNSTVTYNASGDKTKINYVYLSLFAYQKHEKEARAELDRLVQLLETQLGLTPIPEISDAILKARVGTWEQNGIIGDVRTEKFKSDTKGSSTCVLFYEKGAEVPPPGEC